MLKSCWATAIVVCLLCVGAWNSSAGSNVRFTVERIGKERGLPQSVVLALCQTKDGYLWIGTPQGLARFDGNHATFFDENNTPELTSSQITRIFEDAQGNLWLGTATAGVLLLDKGGRLRRLDSGATSAADRMMAACQDSSGVVWLYRANAQLQRYFDGKLLGGRPVGLPTPVNYRGLVPSGGQLLVATDWSLTTLSISEGTKPGPPPPTVEEIYARVSYILVSKSGGYWLLANNRIQRIKEGRLERDLGAFPWVSGATNNLPIYAACEDRAGNLIVGTYGAGVYWFDSAGKYTHLGTEEGLSHNSIVSLVIDRSDCLWVGSNGGGLNRVRRQAFEVVERTKGSVVQSVCEDSGGGLWVGYTGNRIDYWSGSITQQFQLLPKWLGQQHGLSVDVDPSKLLDVKTVFAGRRQGVLAGVWSASAPHWFRLNESHFEEVGLPPELQAFDKNASATFEDREGRLWLGTQAGLLRVEGQTVAVASSNDVRAIAEDREGNIWVGTEGDGIHRLSAGTTNANAGSKYQEVAFHKRDGLPSENISSLYVDNDGVLWSGTSGGLARFYQGNWTHYSKEEGLSDNSIGYIIEDNQACLWLGSNIGLMRIRKKDLNDFAAGLVKSVACRVYGAEDGLPADECTSGSQPGAARTRDGLLWFPTIRGLAHVNPARLEFNTNPPPVIIESARIDGALQNAVSLRTPRLESITVPAGKEALEIDFTSLNLSAPDKGRFRYRLESYEKDWVNADARARAAHYSKLPPGQYRFHVIASNEDEVWNEIGSFLTVIIKPAFWQTWWFIIGMTLLMLGMVIGSVHYVSTQKLQRQVERLRHQEALEKERARIARDIHDQVGASLTQMSLLGELVESDKDNPTEVEAHGKQISQAALETTRALDEIVWTVNPSNDTLEGLVNYICKYAQEYLAVAGLKYRVEAPSQLPAVTISPELRHNFFLAAKEAVTNIVRHAHGSAAWLRVSLEPGRFVVEMEDNGSGLSGNEDKSTRNGLKNMRKRMEDVGGKFEIGPGSDKGTKVRLSAPISS